jgi:hypothetical protein
MDTTEARPPAATTDPRRFAFLAILAIAFLLAAVVGAYVDWLWWPVYYGIVLTIIALPIVLIGGILAVITHGRMRRLALVVLAIGVGLLAGQNLGPSRAPLQVADGSMSIVLDGPVVATSSGPATCSVTEDGAELSVSGDPNMRLDTPDRPFVNVFFDRGDRWEAYRGGPRSNGIYLVISVTPTAVPDSGKPATLGMGADESSTVTVDANQTGGVIRFAHLVPLTGADYTGEAMDLSGRIEFLCDAPPPG